jgi:septal ring-binding cell division protein DamX
VQAKPSWRIPGFGNDKKEPVLDAVAPAVVATTSVVHETANAANIPTLQDTPREPALLSEDATTQTIDPTAASTVFEKPKRNFPWGWLLLVLLLSGAAAAYMHRDVVAEEIEQFKKYLLRGTPAVAMTPEDVASAEAAAKAAAEAASAASAAVQAQSEAQAASEPQAVASTASASASANASANASEASPKEVLPAATEATPKDTKTNRSKKSDDLPDEAWVKQLTDSSYVLQLSAADTEEEILKFKNSHPIYAKARVMSAPKKDSKKRYFILVAGPFENKTDADTYVNSHPLLSKGWLRNAKSMRNQFLRTQP